MCVFVWENNKRKANLMKDSLKAHIFVMRLRFIALASAMHSQKIEQYYFQKTVVKLNFRTNFSFYLFFFLLSFLHTTIAFHAHIYFFGWYSMLQLFVTDSSTHFSSYLHIYILLNHLNEKKKSAKKLKVHNACQLNNSNILWCLRHTNSIDSTKKNELSKWKENKNIKKCKIVLLFNLVLIFYCLLLF